MDTAWADAPGLSGITFTSQETEDANGHEEGSEHEADPDAASAAMQPTDTVPGPQAPKLLHSYLGKRRKCKPLLSPRPGEELPVPSKREVSLMVDEAGRAG